MRAAASIKPGMRVVRRTDSSSRRGFFTLIPVRRGLSSGMRNESSCPGPRKLKVCTSLKPAPTSTSRRRRRADWAGERDPSVPCRTRSAKRSKP